MNIMLPFKPYFEPLMLTGVKSATSRTKKFGKPGDTFRAFGATFEFTSVDTVRLDFVAARCFKAEGFTSSRDFIHRWLTIHPFKGYDPSQVVYLHHFKRVA